MSASERILIKILAQIQLRVMAKQQSGSINPDSVDQSESSEIDKTTINLIDINNNASLLEKADNALR